MAERHGDADQTYEGKEASPRDGTPREIEETALTSRRCHFHPKPHHGEA